MGKVQKIKEEIERRINLLQNGDADPEVMKRVEGVLLAYNSILEFIDSLPKEPASEDLEEEIKRYINEEVIVTNENVVISKHYEFHNFYVENLVDVARHFAEWQKDKDAVPSCKNLYNAIKEEQEKKSFHDDFEKASYAQGMIDGSMWQKQQMKEVLQTEYEKGRFDMREEMMKDAVDAIVYKGLYSKYIKEQDSDALSNALEGYNPRDKVKIIIVKGKQQ